MGFTSMLLPQQTKTKQANTQQIKENRESDFENEEYWIYISIRY